MILATMILVMILYTELHRLIGLKLPIVSDPLILGIRAMRVWLRIRGIFFKWKILLISSMTDPPTTSQNPWKKSAGRLTGPRDLNGFRDHRACLISSSWTGKLSIWTSSSNKEGVSSSVVGIALEEEVSLEVKSLQKLF